LQQRDFDGVCQGELIGVLLIESGDGVHRLLSWQLLPCISGWI
jgi:hypothetical protein